MKLTICYRDSQPLQLQSIMITLSKITVYDSSSPNDNQVQQIIGKQPGPDRDSITSFRKVHLKLATVGHSTKLLGQRTINTPATTMNTEVSNK